MSTKKGRTRCPKCGRRMSKPSRYEWLGRRFGQGDGFAWMTICLQCVREHDNDPLLHLRANKMARIREKV